MSDDESTVAGVQRALELLTAPDTLQDATSGIAHAAGGSFVWSDAAASNLLQLRFAELAEQFTRAKSSAQLKYAWSALATELSHRVGMYITPMQSKSKVSRSNPAMVCVHSYSHIKSLRFGQAHVQAVHAVPKR